MPNILFDHTPATAFSYYRWASIDHRDAAAQKSWEGSKYRHLNAKLVAHLTAELILLTPPQFLDPTLISVVNSVPNLTL